MSPPTAPSTMRAWIYEKNSPTLESCLTLRDNIPLPSTSSQPLQPHQLLIRVRAAALNPADFKAAELPLGLGRLIKPVPATPGMDFAGEVVAAGSEARLPPSAITSSGAETGEGTWTTPEVGTPVFGRLEPGGSSKGALSEYVVAGAGDCARMPGEEVMTFEEACGLGTAGLTAYQAIVPYLLSSLSSIEPNDDNTRPLSQRIAEAAARNEAAGRRVLVNGASGGVGTMAVQIAARGMGCGVTGTCSGRNAEFVKEVLGVDDVIDYTTSEDAVLAGMSQRARGERGMKGKFALVVDNVGGSPKGLVRAADEWMENGGKGATVIQIGAGAKIGDAVEMLSRFLWPSWLGGGKSRYLFILTKNSSTELTQLARWVAEGKVKPIVDEIFEFAEAKEAFAKLRKGRTRGKIIVRVD